ncbi:Uncharacterized protein OS=Thalassobacter stenotrophicus GN=PM03_12725 PE=4 SV=1 [Gemmata massiliana]|uniref:Uncharacterized protein n=1 Tax=Gemmata massiliana TaxID=1210884 RepID=A0A6P2CPI9_9BACT|nr:hypothetical protein [Gemmata massiliana]VTR90823.1 Uncharacterized protein OS=Thalassobacter stenotrophicus GN=PM03_12725 PE=4 SV=1 [Gemmata massiliana]
MPDAFANCSAGLESPYEHCALIVPSDSADLPFSTRGISFGAAGMVRVTMIGGETVTIPSGALAAGAIHALRVVRVHSTGTTATGLVAYW